MKMRKETFGKKRTGKIKWKEKECMRNENSKKASKGKMNKNIVTFLYPECAEFIWICNSIIKLLQTFV